MPIRITESSWIKGEVGTEDVGVTGWRWYYRRCWHSTVVTGTTGNTTNGAVAKCWTTTAHRAARCAAWRRHVRSTARGWCPWIWPGSTGSWSQCHCVTGRRSGRLCWCRMLTAIHRSSRQGRLSISRSLWIIAYLTIQRGPRMHQLASFKWCAQLLATELSIHRRSRMNHLRLDRRSWVLAGLTVERSSRMHDLRWLVWLMPQVSTTYLSIIRCPWLSQLIVHQWLLIPGCCFTIARNQTVAHVRQRAEKVWRAEWWKAGTCTLNTVVVSWHSKQTCDFNNQSIQQQLLIQRVLKAFDFQDLNTQD